MNEDKLFFKFLKIIKGRKKKLIFIFFLIFFAGILDLMSFSMLASIVGTITSPELISSNKFVAIGKIMKNINFSSNLLIAILLFIFIFRGILSIFINYLIIKFSVNNEKLLKKRLLSNYIFSDFQNYINKNSSQQIHTINYMTSLFTSQVLITSLNTISSVIIGLMILSLLAYTNLNIFLFCIIFFLIIVLVYDLLIKKTLSRIGKDYNISSSDVIRSISETLNGFKEVRLYNKVDIFIFKFEKILSRAANLQIKNNLFSTMPKYILETSLMIVGIIIVLNTLSEKDGLSLAESMQVFVVFAVAAVRLLPMTNQIIVNVNNIRYSKHTISTLYDDLQSGNPENSNFNNNNNFNFDKIEFKDVFFKYKDSENYTLKGVDFEIKKNHILGIKGASGSGKSTFINCLTGLLIPQKGILKINEKTENFKQLENLSIAYIPQKLFFLDDTIRNNITLNFENEEIDENLFQRALNMSQLKNSVNNFPKKLDTVIGENGAKISGGQGQRIAIARAIYHNKKILILDESTSALDIETEKEIINELVNLRKNFTLIIISHRLSTLDSCDAVYNLSNGKFKNINEIKET